MSVKHLKNRATEKKIVEVLTALKEAGYDGAKVAGGAIRDDYFGKRPNDLDVYIYTRYAKRQCASRVHDFIYTLYKAFPLASITTKGRLYHDQLTSGIMLVFSVIIKDEMPIDVIFVDKPVEEYLLTDYSFNLSKCWYDLESGVTYTDKFYFDVARKELTCEVIVSRTADHDTLFAKMQHIAYTINKHYQKMQKYFPGYTLRMEIKYE